MKKKLLVILPVVFLTILGGLWTYQAKYADSVFIVPVPRFIMGETNKNVSYDIVIGKSQIHPWGTL